jgi:hypothetical protein
VGAGTISGTVQDASQQPASGVLVTLVSDSMKDGRYDLLRTARAGQNGEFNLRNIPPGDYKLYAWENVDEPGGYMDAEYLRPFDSKALKVSVKPNSRWEVSLKVISAEDTSSR